MDNCSISVALLFGGAGCERDVSVMGADFVKEALKSKGFHVITIIIKPTGDWFSTESNEWSAKDMELGRVPLFPTFPVRLGNQRGFISDTGILNVDAMIPLLHGEGGEDGAVQGALDCSGIPYIGCGVSCSAICLDKAFLKLVAKDIGIPTVKGIYTTEYSEKSEIKRLAQQIIGYPMFVKPTRLGSSIGARRVLRAEELDSALENAYRYSKRILIEELVDGARELECAVVSKKGKFLFTNIGKILCDSEFYDYESKYAAGSRTRISTHAKIDKSLELQITEYARRIAEAVGILGLSRIDFFLDRDENIYLNEINTLLGMTALSMFPRLISEAGIPLAELLESLVHEAVL